MKELIKQVKWLIKKGDEPPLVWIRMTVRAVNKIIGGTDEDWENWLELKDLLGIE